MTETRTRPPATAGETPLAPSPLLTADYGEHGARAAIDDELHARPSLPVAVPAIVEHLAFLLPRAPSGGTDPAPSLMAPLMDIAGAHGVTPPDTSKRQVVLALGQAQVKWERHSEFVTFTVIRPQSEQNGESQEAVRRALATYVREQKLERLVALQIVVGESNANNENGDARALLDRVFGPGAPLAGARLLDGATLWTDFRVGPDGVSRAVFQNESLPDHQVGRLVQRFMELETYRVMAMLGLTVAREAMPVLDGLEEDLSDIAGRMVAPSPGADDHELLNILTDVTARAEKLSNDTAFRLSATEAYGAIVEQRLVELRQTPVAGMQRLTTFLERRLGPALATCASVRRRQEQLAQRISRASNLLRTRVDIALEMQNQRILTSMEENARSQLQLQHAVERFSVVAIAYYAVALFAYLAYGLLGEREGFLSPPTVTALFVIPAVITVALLAMRWHRQAIRETRK